MTLARTRASYDRLRALRVADAERPREADALAVRCGAGLLRAEAGVTGVVGAAAAREERAAAAGALADGAAAAAMALSTSFCPSLESRPTPAFHGSRREVVAWYAA
jgi:hypothetical protein